MVISNDINLPTEAELTVPEVNLSGPALRAGSFHLGKYCEYQNNVRKHQIDSLSLSDTKESLIYCIT